MRMIYYESRYLSENKTVKDSQGCWEKQEKYDLSFQNITNKDKEQKTPLIMPTVLKCIWELLWLHTMAKSIING